MHENLFASFILDAENELEIALQAEHVTEATETNLTLQHLPSSIDYLEGIMVLRENIIPVINLKKRLGLAHHTYHQDAKVAIVHLHNQQLGLLFDDIQEVFKADDHNITPINSLLQSDDKIISAIIRQGAGSRTIELLDLNYLFKGQSAEALRQLTHETPKPQVHRQTTYSRWVVFSCFGQLYGVPVKYSREIAFLSEIDEMFKSGNVEGAIQLRGSTIPVLNGRYLLSGEPQEHAEHQDNRVLILASEDCSFGMMVDEIHEILTVADEDILKVPSDGQANLHGIYPQENRADILLLDMPTLVCSQIDDIKSLARINGDTESAESLESVTRSHHLITENCYLIFAIHKNFAIELKDVQEIIEGEDIMQLPRTGGFSNGVINLRGEIVPVVNLRRFYGYPGTANENLTKLVICRGSNKLVALEVDHIVTIFKQEDYHSTPSLNPQLAEKKDTLDRLIEYDNEQGLKEHVLVVNMHNLVRNHLEIHNDNEPTITESAIASEE